MKFDILKLIKKLEKLKYIPCPVCKGSGYKKLGDWQGNYAVSCDNRGCSFGNIMVDNDFRWKTLLKEIKREENES